MATSNQPPARPNPHTGLMEICGDYNLMETLLPKLAELLEWLGFVQFDGIWHFRSVPLSETIFYLAIMLNVERLVMLGSYRTLDDRDVRMRQLGHLTGKIARVLVPEFEHFLDDVLGFWIRVTYMCDFDDDVELIEMIFKMGDTDHEALPLVASLFANHIHHVYRLMVLKERLAAVRAEREALTESA